MLTFQQKYLDRKSPASAELPDFSLRRRPAGWKGLTLKRWG
jgi:hypothetical protein